MYEVIHFGEKTHYIDCPTKIGIYNLNEKDICLIDSGNSRDTAKKIYKIIVENGWNLKAIINTHGHADHIGGSGFLQSKTGCEVFLRGMDRAFLEFPELISSYLYGGNSSKPLRHKFINCDPAKVTPLTKENIPEGLELMEADGHSFNQTMIKTSDNAWFVADTVASKETVDKYSILFVQNIAKHIETLEKMKDMQGDYFIPAHADCTTDILPLVEYNLQKVLEVASTILEICKTPTPFEDILSKLCVRYNYQINFLQSVLTGSTVKSYLTYLFSRGELEEFFQDNKQYWKII